MIAAVIPAAGESRRMGRPKLLLPCRGKTLLAGAVELARSVCSEVVVVVGAHCAHYRPVARRAGARVLYHPGWRDGLSSSIRSGVAALPVAAEAALIVLPDQPFVTAEHLRALLDAHARAGAELTFSSYSGTLGAPAVIGRPLFGALPVHGNAGAKALAARARLLAEVALEDPFDVDTPEDARRLAATECV